MQRQSSRHMLRIPFEGSYRNIEMYQESTKTKRRRVRKGERREEKTDKEREEKKEGKEKRGRERKKRKGYWPTPGILHLSAGNAGYLSSPDCKKIINI